MEYRLPSCSDPWNSNGRIADSKKIKSVVSYRHNFNFGNVLYQVLRQDIFSIWYYELTVTAPCSIAIYPFATQFSLHFNLNSEFTIPFDDLPVTLRKGYVYLIYMRNLNYEMKFEPGKYVFCQLDFNYVTFMKEGENIPKLAGAIQLAEEGLGCQLFNGVSINLEDRKLLKTILREGVPLNRIKAQQAGIQLLRSFLEKSF